MILDAVLDRIKLSAGEAPEVLDSLAHTVQSKVPLLDIAANWLSHRLIGLPPIPSVGPTLPTLPTPPTATVHTIAILGGPTKTPIAYIRTSSVLVESRGGNAGATVIISPGTVWFVASLLNPSAPLDGFGGIAFTAAVFTIDGAGVNPNPTEIDVAANVSATLLVHPVSSQAPAPPATPITSDGTAAVASLPAVINFTLAPTAITVNRIDNATATAYGNTVSCSGGPATVTYDADLAEIAIHYAGAPTPTTLTIAANASTNFTLTGTATVLAGSYRLAIVHAVATSLGDAAGGGSLALELGTGLNAQWDARAPVPLADALLHVASGVLGIAGHIAARPTVETFTLWNASPANASPSDGSTRATSITLTAPRGALIRVNENASRESITLFGCSLAGHLDRPLLANGNVATLATLSVTYVLVHNATDTNLIVVGMDRTITISDTRPIEAYVLDNAVLRSRGNHLIVLEAKLAGMQAVSGSLALASQIDALTPILPDPYAADLANFQYAESTLVASVNWATPDDPKLTFAIEPLTNDANANKLANGAISANGDANAIAAANGNGRSLSFAATREGGRIALYDVSSAANQFGVIALGSALNPGNIDGQELVVSGMSSALFTVPSIAWEPVLDPTRTWFTGAISSDDGGLTVVGVLTADLRPLQPKAFLDAFITEFASGDELIAGVTLPFGLTARIDTTTGSNTPVPRPTLTSVEPTFAAAAQTGGRQLRLTATHDVANDRDVMPGSSNANSVYVQDILDNDPSHIIARFWNEVFGGVAIPGGPPATSFVPLSRYDLSGYGASIFSRYNGPDNESGISQARFDVIVGRTAYELVQAISFILPFNIPVVNTTIFERDASGLVLRYNSGWKAKKQGTFVYPGNPLIQNSGVQGVFNVDNITPVVGPLVVANGRNFERVTFDADVYVGKNPATFDLLITGGDAAGDRVPGFESFGSLASRGIAGYLYADADQIPSLADAIALLDEFGSAGGPLTAEVDIASTGIKMALTGIEVKATRADVAPRTLGVALVGTPHLPRDGSWSVATRSASASTPQAVDPHSPVPLVRPLGTAAWHIADAADVVNLASPLRPYGFLQSTGANKVFLEHPTVTNAGAANPLNFAQPPKLADVGKLLGSSGILPAIADLLQFPPFPGMKPSADGFAFTQTLENDIDIPDRVLIPLTPVQLLMSSWHDPANPSPTPTHITLDLDAAASPRWKISMSNVAFKLGVDGWGGAADPLISVHGNVSAQEGSGPSFSGLKVEYGEALSIVKSILTEIESLLAFLPGGDAASLDVSFVGTKLRIREKLPIPKLPIGVGFMEDISLDLGFDVDVDGLSLSFFVGLGDELAPFHWLVSPLSGTGMLALGATDTLGVKMQAGIGLGLAIDVGIVSGSASIVIAVQLDATSSPIGVMVLLTGQASVDVLDGLASASLTLMAGVGLKVSPGDPALLLPPNIPPDVIEFIKQTVVTMSAEVAIGIHLSVCWLVHVDFDGSWEVSETISGATLAALV